MRTRVKKRGNITWKEMKDEREKGRKKMRVGRGDENNDHYRWKISQE